MDEGNWLAERFEGHRPHLRAVAYRMLGSPSDAEDAVQEAWLRLGRADPGGVQNLGGWLTTVVGRVCLDMLRARASRREEAIAPQLPDPAGADPQQEAELADSLGSALLVVLDTLTPTERLAFVLHDVFGVAFKEIAPILSRTPSATKMLASRARQRLRTSSSTVDADPVRQRQVVAAFLAAAREGDLRALLTMLAPDVVLRPDGAAVQAGARLDIRGASAVADQFGVRARGAHQPALIDGLAGAVWAPGGVPRLVFEFTIVRGLIAAIDVIADPDSLSRREVVILES
ncbi:MAG: sigma-70 family RNA polymerase sigma factor [Chloroflexi bacterium]|nr:MAG: sigma-70 family RNA polymerase sigma factor [Chloroflexota bacterium]